LCCIEVLSTKTVQCKLRVFFFWMEASRCAYKRNIILNNVRQHKHFITYKVKATCFDYRLVIFRPIFCCCFLLLNFIYLRLWLLRLDGGEREDSPWSLGTDYLLRSSRAPWGVAVPWGPSCDRSIACDVLCSFREPPAYCCRPSWKTSSYCLHLIVLRNLRTGYAHAHVL